MRIAELEQRTGVSRHTLRYYEKEGLLLEVTRRGNRYRDYPEAAVQRVLMVRQLKELGFALHEIRDLINALRTDSIDCEQGAAIMARKKAEVDAKIEELRSVSTVLERERLRLEEGAAARRQMAEQTTAKEAVSTRV